MASEKHGDAVVRLDEGFTLLEMLVALILFGILSLTLTGTLRFGIRAWEATASESLTTVEESAVHQFLARTIERAQPYSENDGKSVRFDGRRDSLSFVAPLPAHLATKGLHQIVIKSEPSKSGQDLTLSHTVFRPEANAPRTARTNKKTILVQGAKGIRFDYFNGYAEGQSERWQSAWRHREKLPDLVRLQITLEPSGEGKWLDLVVAPIVRLEARCLYDRRRNNCREGLID